MKMEKNNKFDKHNNFAYIFTVSDEHVIRFLKFTVPNLIKIKIKQKIYLYVSRDEEKKYLENNSDKYKNLNIEIKVVAHSILVDFDNVVNSEYNKMGYKTIMYSRLAVLKDIKEEYSFYSDIDVIFNKNPEKEILGFFKNDFVGVIDEYYKMMFKISPKKRKLYKKFFDINNYFCSGTMFMRNESVLKAMEDITFKDFVKETNGELMNDMQYINAVIQRSSLKSIIQKPRAAISRLHTKGLWTFKRPTISHFAGPVKQWDPNFKTYKKIMYKDTLNFIRKWNEDNSNGTSVIGKDILFVPEQGKWSSIDFKENHIVVYGKTKNKKQIAKDLLFSKEII